MVMISIQEFINGDMLKKIISDIIDYSPNVILAVVLLLVGLWAIKWIKRGLYNLLLTRNIEETLRPFLLTMCDIVLKIFLFLVVAAQVGIKTTSFIAIIGAAGLAVGLALQGALANFAAGVLILIFKPFKVGETIEAQEQSGKVIEVSLFITKLQTSQNKTVILPNGLLLSGKILNYSEYGNIRLDLKFNLRYKGDTEEMKKIIIETLKNIPEILSQPEPQIYITEHTKNYVELSVFVYTNVPEQTILRAKVKEIIIRKFP